MASLSSEGSSLSKKLKKPKLFRNDPYRFAGESSEVESDYMNILDSAASGCKSCSSVLSHRGLSTREDTNSLPLQFIAESACSSLCTLESNPLQSNSLVSLPEMDYATTPPLLSFGTFRNPNSLSSEERLPSTSAEQPLLTTYLMSSVSTPPDISCTHANWVIAPPALEKKKKIIFPVGTPLAIRFKYGVGVKIATFPVEKGAHVVVEEDRGFDCGVVEGKGFLQQGISCVAMPKVIRILDGRDLVALQQREQLEKRAFDHISKVAHDLNLTAVVVDVMYRFDQTKVTVVLERKKKSYVDFRQLQRIIFNYCRCRVWIAYLDELN